MARSTRPSRHPALTLEITGHEWWWEVRYRGAAPLGHLHHRQRDPHPRGSPVLVKLDSADVIHAFWVPALTGKTQTIPGRTNISWIEADAAGNLSGPVRPVLRPAARPHGALRHRRYAGAVRRLAAEPAPAVRRPARAGGSGGTGDLHPAAAEAVTPWRAPAPAESWARTSPTWRAGAPSPRAPCPTRRTPSPAGSPIRNPRSRSPKMPPTLLSGPQLREVVAYLETLR